MTTAAHSRQLQQQQTSLTPMPRRSMSAVLLHQSSLVQLRVLHRLETQHSPYQTLLPLTQRVQQEILTLSTLEEDMVQQDQLLIPMAIFRQMETSPSMAPQP